jgi:hypothetical protein
VLSVAIEYGWVHAVKFLLSIPGIDVDACRPHSGRTALHIAAFRGDEDMVQLLLEDGSADPSVPDASGDTPLASAIRANRAGNALALLRHVLVTPSLVATSGSTPPLVLAESINVEVTREYERVHGRMGSGLSLREQMSRSAVLGGEQGDLDADSLMRTSAVAAAASRSPAELRRLGNDARDSILTAAAEELSSGSDLAQELESSNAIVQALLDMVAGYEEEEGGGSADASVAMSATLRQHVAGMHVHPCFARGVVYGRREESE